MLSAVALLLCCVCVCARAREKKKRRRDLLCVYVVHVCLFVFFFGQMMLFHISEMTSSSNKTTCHILNVIIG